MSMRHFRRAAGRLHPSCAVALCAAALCAGCGRASPEPAWFPLNTGASWAYQITTDTDGVVKRSTQTIRVTGEGRFNGAPVHTRRAETSGNIGVEYLLQARPREIVRIAQRTDLEDFPVADAAPRTVLKLPLVVGASWGAPTVAYAVLRKNEFPREMKFVKPVPMTYTVESIDEAVEVPAGRFSGCARVVGRADLTIYADPVSGFRKIPITTTEWYCKEVGLVKLTRMENIETSFFSGGSVEMVLTEYQIR